MIKIAITGPESSGKSTLTKFLADYYDAPFCAEYAREYLTIHQGFYIQQDLDKIAAGQQKQWNALQEHKIAFYDTEMTVIFIWSNVKFGSVSPLIENAIEHQTFTHYLLCKPDIPWEDDPLRENQFDRDALFELYLEELSKRKFPFTIIEGDNIKREAKATDIIDHLLVTHNSSCF